MRRSNGVFCFYSAWSIHVFYKPSGVIREHTDLRQISMRQLCHLQWNISNTFQKKRWTRVDFLKVLRYSSLTSQCLCSFLSCQASAPRLSSKALTNYFFFFFFALQLSFLIAKVLASTDSLCMPVLILPQCLPSLAAFI